MIRFKRGSIVERGCMTAEHNGKSHDNQETRRTCFFLSRFLHFLCIEGFLFRGFLFPQPIDTHCPAMSGSPAGENNNGTCFYEVVSLPVMLVLSMGSPNTVISEEHSLVREILQDSIAWVEQAIAVPGVVSGAAIWFDYNNDCRLDIVMAGMSKDGPVSGIFRNDTAAFVDIQARICLPSERGVAWGTSTMTGTMTSRSKG